MSSLTSGCRRTTTAVLVAAGFALMPACVPAAGPAAVARIEPAADLDGDGHADPVTLQQAGPGRHLLRVTVAAENLDATIGADDAGPLPLTAPRPADLDGDGRDELVVTVAVGANTTTYEVWQYDGRGLRAVTTPDGSAWRLFEGGGVAAIAGYGCAGHGPGRRPFLVEARWDESRPGEEPIRYDGEIVTYELADGVARPVGTQPVADAVRDDPRLLPDPATCAPLQ